MHDWRPKSGSRLQNISAGFIYHTIKLKVASKVYFSKIWFKFCYCFLIKFIMLIVAVPCQSSHLASDGADITRHKSSVLYIKLNWANPTVSIKESTYSYFHTVHSFL